MARVEWIIEHSEDQESVWLAKMVRDARRELAEAKVEIERLAAENKALRQAAGFFRSAALSGEPIERGHCSSCNQALAALAQGEGE